MAISRGYGEEPVWKGLVNLELVIQIEAVTASPRASHRCHLPGLPPRDTGNHVGHGRADSRHCHVGKCHLCRFSLYFSLSTLWVDHGPSLCRICGVNPFSLSNPACSTFKTCPELDPSPRLCCYHLAQALSSHLGHCRSRLTNLPASAYTTCPPPHGQQPAWSCQKVRQIMPPLCSNIPVSLRT